jgi:hypothetical protein
LPKNPEIKKNHKKLKNNLVYIINWFIFAPRSILNRCATAAGRDITPIKAKKNGNQLLSRKQPPTHCGDN